MRDYHEKKKKKKDNITNILTNIFIYIRKYSSIFILPTNTKIRNK